jgi:hypothetical protein
VHSVCIDDVASVEQMTEVARQIAGRERFAEAGQFIVTIVGMPFGTPAVA